MSTGIIYFAFTIVILIILTIVIRRKKRNEAQINNIAEESVRTASKNMSRSTIAGDSVVTQAPKMNPSLLKAYTHIIMSVVISLAIIAFGVVLILKEDIPTETKNWIYGAMGSVIGYWLKK